MFLSHFVFLEVWPKLHVTVKKVNYKTSQYCISKFLVLIVILVLNIKIAVKNSKTLSYWLLSMKDLQSKI